ncbi:DUF551 domain-containing protein [Klebsiella pneumoniae]|uniref:DUF551 domain-containing protein n=1 Tax=Klebsiella pneumoniae TaxID=573 RepID=UPI0034D4E7D2
MTKSTITRERLQEIAEDGFLKHGESKALARMALAAMDSEADCKERNLFCSTDTARMRKVISVSAGTGDAPLYRHAQPAPVVPEEKPIPNTLSMYAVDAVAAIAEVKGWNACRAAMLAAAPQSPGSEPATVPGKWIPVSERMPELGDWLVTDGCDFDVQLFNGEQFIPGFVWEDKITHWMPLPAVPQEVKGE